MGEYFRGIILKPNFRNLKKVVEFSTSSWNYGNGAKEAEHSYVGNSYMRVFEHLLANDFYGFPFVYAGDYADGVFTKKFKDMCIYYRNKEYLLENNSIDMLGDVKNMLGETNWGKLMCDSELHMDYCKDIADFINNEVTGLVASGGVNMYDEANNFEDTSKSFKKISETIPEYENSESYEYAINLDKAEYVKIPKYCEKKWTIHPLPLLCIIGHGLGGGCFDFKSGEEYLGRWAFDRIGLSNEKPNRNFKLIRPNFKEKPWG